jgi:hypothetical protein
MAQHHYPDPSGRPTPTGWSLLLPSWAGAPDLRPRPLSRVRIGRVRRPAASVARRKQERHL